MKNEVYLGLIGGAAGRYWWGVGNWDSQGSVSRVAFDHKKVMEREEKYGDIVGFYHTHPSFPASPSRTDYDTMGAWTLCFGRPLVCLIRGTNGLKAHWFIDDETPHMTSWVKCFGGRIFIGRVPHRVAKKLKEKANGKQQVPS